MSALLPAPPAASARPLLEQLWEIALARFARPEPGGTVCRVGSAFHWPKQIVVRHGKDGKDRVVMLPRLLRPQLEPQLA